MAHAFHLFAAWLLPTCQVGLSDLGRGVRGMWGCRVLPWVLRGIGETEAVSRRVRLRF